VEEEKPGEEEEEEEEEEGDATGGLLPMRELRSPGLSSSSVVLRFLLWSASAAARLQSSGRPLT